MIKVTSNLDQLSRKLGDMAKRAKALDGQQVTVKLTCPVCDSTSLQYDETLGDDAPVTCANGHTAGTIKGLLDHAVAKAAKEKFAEIFGR